MQFTQPTTTAEATTMQASTTTTGLKVQPGSYIVGKNVRGNRAVYVEVTKVFAGYDGSDPSKASVQVMGRKHTFGRRYGWCRNAESAFTFSASDVAMVSSETVAALGEAANRKNRSWLAAQGTPDWRVAQLRPDGYLERVSRRG